jgi:antitoxin component YwqK of YwqJK toxin-antitoxin module
MKISILYFSLFLLIGCSGKSDEKGNQSEVKQKIENEPNSLTTNDKQARGEKNYQEFYDNGALKIEGNKDINGQRSGIWTSYYENGIKWSETYYRKGLKDGHSITFYPNGQVRFIGEYKNDEKYGEWTFNNEDGHPISTESY